MRDEIFKDIPIKKTLIESLERPDGGKPIDILIGNDDKPIRFVEVDNNQQPILTEQESAQLENEQREFGTDLNPSERHQMAVEKTLENGEEPLPVMDAVESNARAVKRNHDAQSPEEVKAQDPKARVKLSKPSEAPKMFAEKMTEDKVEDIAEAVAERVIDEQMLNVEVTEEPKNNNEDKS
jgi:hypothetical protein